jgi:AcrR family transcriptional regulator
MTPAATERTPQAVRRARTRLALLDATIDCLAELGYAGTTTTEVARRAGVSRGAQVHHFPTKAELVAAAVEHTFEQRMVQFRASLADAPASDAHRIQYAIDVVWSMFQGPACVAWVELGVAARTDDELRPFAQRVNDRHREAVEELFVAVLPNVAAGNPFVPVAVKFMLALFDGLVLQRFSGYDDEPGRAEAVVEAAKALATIAFAPPSPPLSPPPSLG